jgi:hypothetical protein
MRAGLLWLAALLSPLIFVACADLPSAPRATSGDMLADCRWNPDGSASCDPVESAPDEPPACDPYLTLSGCDDNCEMSAETGDPEHVGIAGCNKPGPGSGPGGDPFDPGGGGAPPQPPADGDSIDDGICTAGENGTVCESEDRPECERKPDAPGECVTRLPTPTEWAELGQIVARMTENTDYCRGAKAIAQGMYAAGREGGRIVLWNNRNYKPGTNQQEMIWGRNGSDTRGRTIEMDSYLAFQVPSLLAHEALHAYLNSINWPGTLDEQEAWVRGRESECAG